MIYVSYSCSPLKVNQLRCGPLAGIHNCAPAHLNDTLHYTEVIMGRMVSQITSLTIVYSTIYSDADQRKHQTSASLAFVWRIHREPVIYPHKWAVTWKCFHLKMSSLAKQIPPTFYYKPHQIPNQRCFSSRLAAIVFAQSIKLEILPWLFG